MIHRGQIFEQAVRETKTKISELSRHLKVTRNTIYRYFEDFKTDLDILIEAGKFMNHDFSDKIPELKNPNAAQLEKDAMENLDYKIKYFELLERYLPLLEEKSEKYEAKKKDDKKKKS